MTMLLMGIVWNCLTGAAIYAVATQWNTRPMYVVAVVLFVFGLIGLLFIYASVYQLLTFLSPRVKLTTNSSEFRFGGRIDLDWSFTMPQLVQNLEIWLQPDEDEARQDEINQQKVCVYSSSDSSSASRGQASMNLPEKPPRDYIKSRKIAYVLHVKAKIKYLPDVDHEFLLLCGL